MTNIIVKNLEKDEYGGEVSLYDKIYGEKLSEQNSTHVMDFEVWGRVMGLKSYLPQRNFG